MTTEAEPLQGSVFGDAAEASISTKQSSEISPPQNIDLSEKNFTAQIQTKDQSIGRWLTFNNGSIISSSGFHQKSEVVLSFKNANVAVELLMPLVMAFLLKKSINQLDQINALKDLKSKFNQS